MPKVKEALRFVEGNPMADAVRQPVHDHLNVVSEPFRAVRVQPASAKEQFIRIVPMKKRHPRFDALLEQFINQPVIEAQALGSLIDPLPSGITRGQETDSRYALTPISRIRLTSSL